MKQEKLKEHRNYRMNPRSAHEGPDPDFRDDLNFGDEVSRTKQSEAEACDINNIMKKYQATGILPDADGRQPMWEDFSEAATFMEALHIVSQAQSSFHALPAEIRSRFGNDPAQFLAFVEKGSTDAEVGKELVSMGLANVPVESPEKILKDIRENTKSKPEPKEKA